MPEPSNPPTTTQQKKPRDRKRGLSPHPFSRRVSASTSSGRFPDSRPLRQRSYFNALRIMRQNLGRRGPFHRAPFVLHVAEPVGVFLCSAGRSQWRGRGPFLRASLYPENNPAASKSLL